MFDSYTIRPTQYVPTTVNVTEKRAPTDQSVALLKEMEQAALWKVIAVIKNENNDFHFAAHLIDNPADPFNYKAYVRFTLNHREIGFSFDLAQQRFNPKGHELLREIYNQCGARIASEMMLRFASQMVVYK